MLSLMAACRTLISSMLVKLGRLAPRAWQNLSASSQERILLSLSLWNTWQRQRTIYNLQTIYSKIVDWTTERTNGIIAAKWNLKRLLHNDITLIGPVQKQCHNKVICVYFTITSNKIHTHTDLIAVLDVRSGHPSVRTRGIEVGFRFWVWRWIEVCSTNCACLKQSAVLHLPLA